MFACIFVPDFPVEAVVRSTPEMRAQPVAVVAGKPPVLNVIAANEQARHLGVELGMTQLQAQGRVRGIEIRRRSLAQETSAAAALLDCACAFSPRVEQISPDTVVLDIEGLERLFGAPPALARDMAKRASDIGLEANVAIAQNMEAAIHAARGFAGLAVIPPGRETERLGALPIDVLFTEADESARGILETLDRWGVRTFRALAALPEIALSERLGAEGLRLRRLARGDGDRKLQPADAPLTFEEAVELEYPVDLLEPLAFLLNRMLEQLCARLTARALATNELRVRLQLERDSDADVQRATDHKPELVRTIRLPVPMLDARVFLKLLQLDMRANPPQAPVEKIWLSMEPVRPRFTQGGLFLPVAPEPERLEITLARIASVVGGAPECVGSAEVVDTHRPDAFRMKRFAAPLAIEGKSTRCGHFKNEASQSGDDRNAKGTTPLRRFRPPLAARVMLRDGCPARVNAIGHGGDVVWAAGPWHTSGDWWEENSWSRETWDVAINSETEVLYRVFCDAEKHWFLEGVYD